MTITYRQLVDEITANCPDLDLPVGIYIEDNAGRCTALDSLQDISMGNIEPWLTLELAHEFRFLDCVSVTFHFDDLVQRFWEVNDNRDGTPSQLDAAWKRLTINDKLQDTMADAGWSAIFDAICAVIDKEG